MVKKVSMFVIAALMTVSLAACGNSTSDQQESENSAEQAQTETDQTTETQNEEVSADGENNSIVVYFSWSGNTEAIAEEIQNQTGSDIFELTPVTPYSSDYDTVLDEAQAEQRENARPEIAGTIENFEQYDVVYLGYPNWWGDMPMIVYSLLDDYDFAGKTIVPFVSSGGSGFSDSLTTIAEMESEAVLTDGLSLGSSESEDPAGAVEEWLSSLTIE